MVARVRAAALLLALSAVEGLVGCAGTAAAPSGPPPGSPAAELIRRSDAYRSFHYIAEIKDAKTAVRVELGYQAPDRGFLRYGSSYAVYYAGGVGHYYFKQGYARFDAAAELARLRKDYPGVEIGGEPQLSFLLSQWDALVVGRGLKATLGPQRAPRLNWLTELGRWTHDGLRFRKEPIEVRLREDGFFDGVSAGSAAELRGLEASIDAPLDESLFAPPPREGLNELPAHAKEELARAFEDAFRRWALEHDASDAAIRAMVASDIERLYEPGKMVDILKESLAKSLETWKSENKEARRELLAEKLKIDKGKTLGGVEIMEKDIQANFERALERSFRSAAAPLPHAFTRDVARRWRDATSREVRLRIAEPFEKVFEDALKD
jgi:hypothetical protein